MEIVPINERILIKIVETPNITGSGIHLPGGSVSLFADVIAKGEGRVTEDGKRIPIAIEKGQRVMLTGARVGVEVMVEGTAHRMITERDILALVR